MVPHSPLFRTSRRPDLEVDEAPSGLTSRSVSPVLLPEPPCCEPDGEGRGEGRFGGDGDGGGGMSGASGGDSKSSGGGGGRGEGGRRTPGLEVAGGGFGLGRAAGLGLRPGLGLERGLGGGLGLITRAVVHRAASMEVHMPVACRRRLAVQSCSSDRRVARLSGHLTFMTMVGTLTSPTAGYCDSGPVSATRPEAKPVSRHARSAAASSQPWSGRHAG